MFWKGGHKYQYNWGLTTVSGNACWVLRLFQSTVLYNTKQVFPDNTCGYLNQNRVGNWLEISCKDNERLGVGITHRVLADLGRSSAKCLTLEPLALPQHSNVVVKFLALFDSAASRLKCACNAPFSTRNCKHKPLFKLLLKQARLMLFSLCQPLHALVIT